jgi:hypothetical protein
MKLDGSNLLIRKEIIRLINSRVYLVKFPRALERQYSHQYKTEAARTLYSRVFIYIYPRESIKPYLFQKSKAG